VRVPSTKAIAAALVELRVPKGLRDRMDRYRLSRRIPSQGREHLLYFPVVAARDLQEVLIEGVRDVGIGRNMFEVGVALAGGSWFAHDDTQEGLRNEAYVRLSSVRSTSSLTGRKPTKKTPWQVPALTGRPRGHSTTGPDSGADSSRGAGRKQWATCLRRNRLRHL
jgi:hypothetical protein